MNCIIVDDELLAHEVIEFYVNKVDFLQLVGKYSNAIQVFTALNKEPKIDLIFLDIKMPEMTGLEFIRTIKNPPKIILTTAFHEYALEGFELDVVDYLLKPISFERFIKAVGKAKNLHEPHTNSSHLPDKESKEFYVKSDRKLVKVNPSEITYIEGMKNYLSINTINQKIIIHNTMSNLEEELKSYSDILRIHKSFFVNKNYIKEIEGNLIKLSTDIEVPLGGVYKDAFMGAMRVV
jgi:DNA-binding LytR/AlgR family response regulator